MEGEELVRLGVEIEEAADALRAKAAEVPSPELAKRIERLTQHTLAWYVGTRARVEVRAGPGTDDANG